MNINRAHRTDRLISEIPERDRREKSLDAFKMSKKRSQKGKKHREIKLSECHLMLDSFSSEVSSRESNFQFVSFQDHVTMLSEQEIAGNESFLNYNSSFICNQHNIVNACKAKTMDI